MPTLYTQADSNVHKTWFLISCFLVCIIFLGWFFSYLFNEQWILVIAVIFAVSQTFLSYWYSDKIILLSVRAKGPITKEDNLQLYRIAENLSITAGLPMPKIYIIDDPALNAFATGRDAKHAVICVTQGLLNKLEKTELEGVIAHELAHIGNRDILLTSVIIVLVGVTTLLSDVFLRSIRGIKLSSGRRSGGNNLELILLIAGLVFVTLSPIVAVLLQLAISRKREFLADATGALLTRFPDGLARALEKISQDSLSVATASSATAHLFIANPLKQKQALWFSKLLSTHPPITGRIAILRQMAL